MTATGTARRWPGPHRQTLAADWEIAWDGAASTSPSTPGSDTPVPPESGWIRLSRPQPVAAALAEAGLWSIDGPPRDFDAETWWYRLTLDAPADAVSQGARLGLDGLATCCTVWFNGVEILRSRSMFRAYMLELPAASWRPVGNQLLLRFEALAPLLAQPRPRPRWRAPMVAHPQLRWWRTALWGRTPGWSPAAAVVGPWRDVWLEPSGDDAVEVIERHATLEAAGAGECDRGVLRLAVRWHAAQAPGARLSLVLRHGAQRIEQFMEAEAGAGEDGDGLWRAVCHIDAVRPWWPHTHGEPALYRLSLQLARPDAAPVERPLGTVGFRRVTIDRADGDFGVQVNGVPVFCRGACWTPADPVRLQASPSSYRALVAPLVDAGLNMLRVSGAFVYEDPAFFEACDAAGVMVWQEFMCANMDYPADDPAFADDLETEVAQQLASWRDHACVAVVCGNSEVAQQAAMSGAARAAWAPALFHETLARRVADALPDTPYWPSSAEGGAFPFQPDAGTCSYYGVGAYLRPLDDARACGLRFATECLAFAQVPDDAALARLAALQDGRAPQVHQPLWKERVPRDLAASWDFDEVRDHYLERLYRVPAADLRRHDLQTYWAWSRAALAETVEAAFNRWRDPRSACRGALVWFLRDARAGAGWGLQDEQGRPKSAFHALARACQPLHLGSTDDGQNGVSVQVVNDTAAPLVATLALSFHQRGEFELASSRRELRLPPRGAWCGSALAGLDRWIDLNGSYRFGPPAADLVVARLLDERGEVLRESVLFPSPPDGALHRPADDIGLQAQLRAVEAAPDRVEVEIRTRAGARGVHFSAPGWRADDEYFHLPPGGRRVVRFMPVCAPPAGRPRVEPSIQVSAVNARGWTAVRGRVGA